MSVNAAQVKELRERTGAGMMECKAALTESGGDMVQAAEILRKKGILKSGKLAGREAKSGRVGSYVHFNGTLAAIVEVDCETDFVANTDDFQNLVRDVALHIACTKPTTVSREQLPADLVEKEKATYADQIKGKPAEIADRILQGKLEKGLYLQHVLLDQPFCNEERFKGTIGEMVKAVSGKLGENVVIRRFAWTAVGVGGAASL